MSASETNYLRRPVKDLALSIHSHLSGDGPIFVFDFLTRFIEEVGTRDITKSQANRELQTFFTANDSLQYIVTHYASHDSSREVSTYPVAVQCPLHTYKTLSEKRQGLSKIRSLKAFQTRMN